MSRRHDVPGHASSRPLAAMLAVGLLVTGVSALAAPRANVNGSSYFIGGTYIEMGMNSSGAFGSEDAAPGGYHASSSYGGRLGFVNTTIAADFFLPGNPYEAFGAGYTISGSQTTGECKTVSGFTGTCTGLAMDGGYPTATTSGSNAVLTSRHTLGSLRLTQQFNLPENEKYVEIVVTAQNLSGSTMTDVRYVRDFDPDQGYDVCSNYSTTNIIQRTPSSHGFAAVQSDTPCGSANSFVYLSTQLGAKGRVGSSGAAPYSAQWSGEQAAGTTNGGADDWMAIMVPFGDIPAGQSKSATYYMLIDPAGINDFEANVLKTITTSVASGSGTVTPPSTSVAAGGTASFNLTGSVGWVPSTSVGGTCPVGSWSGNTYTTGVITDNCAISFNFQAATYTVSTSVAGSGSISPTSATVTHGNSTSFTVTPNADNTIGTVSGCGGSLSGSTYTTGSITGACTVSVQFRANQTINFPNPGLQVFTSGGTFPLVATASSGLTVSFAGSSPSVCTVSGSTATMVAPGECVVTASQAGNTSYNAAPNVIENIQVGRIPTTTSISSTSTGASSLTNEGFDISVSVASQGVGDPTGSATVRALTAGGATMGSCVATLGAPVGGVATGSCSIATGVLQPHDAVTRLVADYSGDTNDDVSTSTDFAFSVLPGEVAITPVVSDVTVVSGEVIAVTVALDAVAPALGPVTGDGSNAPDLQVATSEAGTSCSIDWDLTNVCSLHFTGVNNTSQLLTAIQGGDPKAIAAAKASLVKTLSVSYLATTDFNAAGPTATDPVTVSSAPTTTVLSTAGVSSATDPSIYGEGIRLTAVVTADAPSTITPRGLVQFTRDSDVLGTVALNGSGIASFDAPPRTTGSEIYYAFFLTNDDFVGSDDDDEHTVAKSPTATTISAVNPVSPEALQTVTVSASVAAVAPGAGTPTGSIVISGDNTAGCTISLPAASCDLTFATKGSKTLTATYTGDSQFLASGASSDTELVEVVGIPVTVSVTGTTPTPHYYGTAYTVAYTVSGGDGSFDGSVTITTAPGSFTCTGSATGGSGSCDIVAPNGSVGSYDLSAAYAGDSTDAGATSGVFSHAISQATTALVLSGNTLDPIDAAETVTVSLDLSMTNGIAPLAGTITVAGLHTTGCSVTLLGGESFPQTCDLSFSVVGTREITATFTPTDALNVAGSSSNTISYDVIRAITTTEITGYSPASGVAQVGDAVTLSFTVSGGVLPYDGAVSVEYGSGPSVCAPVAFDTGTGLGSCVIPATDLQLAGDYPISVAYAGDSDDVPSSDSDTLSVIARSTAITLASSPADNAEAGDAITWTVAVSPVGGAATTPITGLVHVCPASAPVCDAGSASCSIDLSSSTTCSLSYDEPQTVSLVAQYVGDANYAPSLSVADGITIERAASSIAITSNLSASIVVGQTLSVAFDVDGGHQTYDGTVSLTASLASPATTVTCGPVSVDAATGVGSCAFSVADTTALLHSGSWTIGADYAGDSNDLPSSSSPVSQTVTSAGTQTTLVSDPDPTLFGEPFTLTATVVSTGSSSAIPQGEVEFFDHTGVSYGTANLGPDGTITLNGPSNLPVGLYSGGTAPFRAFKAVFKVNPDFATSVDPSEPHTIGAASVSLGLVSATEPSVAGDSVTFTGTATSVAPSVGTPTGTLTITAVGPTTVSCTTPALSGSGNSASASCSLTLPLKGSYSVTATYDNTDGNFNDVSVGEGSISQTVTGVPTTLSLGTPSPASPIYGQTVNLPFTVSGGLTTHDGTVELSVDGNVVCAAAVVNTVSGAGSCDFLPPSVATYAVTAAYSGDSDEDGSSDSDSFAVAKQTPTLSVDAPVTADAGSTFTVSASLGTTGTVSFPPSGVITISTDGSESGCSITLPATSCDMSLTAVGAARVLTASYTGDDNFNAAVDGTDTIEIVTAPTTLSIDALTATPVVGQALDIDFTVSGGVAPHDGTVDVSIGASLVCDDLAIDANTGVGRCSVPSGVAAAGSYTVSVDYAGDANEGPASDTESLVVAPAEVSLSLLSSANPSNAGDLITVTGTATTSAPGNGTPTGTLTITATGPAPALTEQSCTTVALVGAGNTSSASCDLTLAAQGSYTLTATYDNTDGNFVDVSVASGSTAQTVNGVSTTLTLDATTPASPVYGDSISLPFTVSGGLNGNTGTVDVGLDGGQTGCDDVALTASAGSCTVTPTVAGTFAVSALYNGDGSDVDDASATASSSVVVAKQTPTLEVSAAPTATTGETVTATVSLATVGTVSPPTGSITVSVDGTETGCSLGASGGSCDVTFVVTGNPRVITASYSGDGNFNAVSDTADVVVSSAASTVSIDGFTPASPLVGEPVSLAFTVSDGVAPHDGAISVSIDPTPGLPASGDEFTCASPVFDANSGLGSCALGSFANAGSYAVSVSYAGDANEQGDDASSTLVVAPASASLSLLSASNPSIVGNAVSFAATVSRIAPATGDAQGTVTVTAIGPAPALTEQSCTSAALVAGEAACSLTFTSVGSYSVSATYASSDGNTQDITVGTATLTQVVNVAAAQISIDAVTPASPLVGQAASVSFTVSGGYAGNDGLVTISSMDGASNPGPSCTGLAASVGTCSLTFSAAGTYTLSASYNAGGEDASDSAASDTLAGLVVQPAEGGLLVNLDDSSPDIGQTVLITASVNGIDGITPTGSIAVTRGGAPVCVITLPATTCSVSFDSLGSTPLDFAYSGDANYAATSTQVPLTVSPAATTLSITGVSASSVLAGQSSVVSYSLSGGYDGNSGTVVVTAVNGASTVTCSGSVADGQCELTLPVRGSYAVSAVYNGDAADANDASSSATGPSISVSRSPTVTVLTVSPASSGVFGDTVTLTAEVHRNAAGVGQPQGPVTFLVDGASIGEVDLDPSGIAVFTTSTLPRGTRVLRAEYNLSNDYLQSFDEKSFLVTNKPVDLAIVSLSPSPSDPDESVTATISIAAAAGYSGTPTGTVAISTGSGGPTCNITLPATTCVLSFANPGSYTVTAAYSGDADFEATSVTASHSVDPGVSDLVLSLAADYAAGSGVVGLDLVVRNDGPNLANGATVVLSPDAGYAGLAWTCSGFGGATCPASGSGAVNSAVSIPSGGRVEFSITGTLVSEPTTVDAEVSAPSQNIDPNLSNNVASVVLEIGLFADGFEDVVRQAVSMKASGLGGWEGLTLDIAPLADAAAAQRIATVLDGKLGQSEMKLQMRQAEGGMQARLLTRVDAKALWQIGEWQALGNARLLSIDWQSAKLGQHDALLLATLGAK